jgi:hypothetical protein
MEEKLEMYILVKKDILIGKAVVGIAHTSLACYTFFNGVCRIFFNGKSIMLMRGGRAFKTCLIESVLFKVSAYRRG